MVSRLKRIGRCFTCGLLVCLAAAITLFYVQGCSGPPLKPWHTERLSAEFTAQKADEIQGFDAYRRLEDEVFA